MSWLDSASRWIIESYREGLTLSCPHHCRERAEKRREQVREAIRRNRRRILH